MLTSLLPVNLALFLTASIALLLVPGPAVLYIMTRSIDQGRKAGLISVAGIHSATFVHILAAALGLSDRQNAYYRNGGKIKKTVELACRYLTLTKEQK